MPLLSRCFVRTAFICMALGFTLGALLLSDKALGFEPRLAVLAPVHIQWLLWGWMLQLAVGVSFWIMPRFLTPERTLHRGRAWLAGLAYFLLNAGLVVTTVGYAADLFSLPVVAAWLPVTGSFLMASGIISYILHIWTRVGYRPLEG